jgi:23S rRNA (uridine2552-2'-O)-methyltransferase
VTYQRKDAHYRRARAEGYRARSVYKLAELDRRYGILRRGDAVVDLGAWPGGWLQLALERIGNEGRIVGVDLAAVEKFPAPNVALMVGDVRDAATADAILDRLGRRADVVLSDLAPKLTGIRATDEAHSEELNQAALALLPRLLAPSGRFVMKTFMGGGFEAILRATRAQFSEVKTTRPDATRRGSSELYVVGLGFLAKG